jgi:hypothetical protein
MPDRKHGNIETFRALRGDAQIRWGIAVDHAGPAQEKQRRKNTDSIEIPHAAIRRHGGV